MVEIEFLTNSYRLWRPRGGFEGVELDLGCGKGAFLRGLAARYPKRLVVGADVMLGRLRRLCRKVNRLGLDNVALLRVGAGELVGHQLPDRCLDRVHVLCPDPWPKRRHRARRLVCSEFLGRLAAKLKPGGICHLSTDDVAYRAFMEQAAQGLEGLERCDRGIEDVADLKTDFEADFVSSGVEVVHMTYRKIGD